MNPCGSLNGISLKSWSQGQQKASASLWSVYSGFALLLVLQINFGFLLNKCEAIAIHTENDFFGSKILEWLVFDHEWRAFLGFEPISQYWRRILFKKRWYLDYYCCFYFRNHKLCVFLKKYSWNSRLTLQSGQEIHLFFFGASFVHYLVHFSNHWFLIPQIWAIAITSSVSTPNYSGGRERTSLSFLLK